MTIQEQVRFFNDDLKKSTDLNQTKSFLRERALSILKVVDLDGNYMGCKLQLCYGGPTVWLDTHVNEIIGYDYPEKATIDICPEDADAIDEIVSKL